MLATLYTLYLGDASAQGTLMLAAVGGRGCDLAVLGMSCDLAVLGTGGETAESSRDIPM